MSAPAATNASTLASGSSTIRWTSLSSGVRIALTSGGPTVSCGQKTPSITSMWTISAPVAAAVELVAEVEQVGREHAHAEPRSRLRRSRSADAPRAGARLAPWLRP